MEAPSAPLTPYQVCHAVLKSVPPNYCPARVFDTDTMVARQTLPRYTAMPGQSGHIGPGPHSTARSMCKPRACPLGPPSITPFSHFVVRVRPLFSCVHLPLSIVIPPPHTDNAVRPYFIHSYRWNCIRYSTASLSVMAPQIDLPPGFRFYPTDEELVVHYLCRKAASQAFPVPVIAEIDLYKFDPWDLPEKALFGEKEWYFFSPRDRKYPNGSRPNRAAGSGYWKATGTDKPIHTAGPSSKVAGVKKALVFYTGKAPRGVKTNWIMHEYRLADAASRAAKRKGSLRLDDWVLCRIYKKVYGAQKAVMFKDSYESSSCLEEETSPPSEPTIHLPKVLSIGMNNLEEDDCHTEQQQQRCRVPRFEESYSHRYLQQEQENNEMTSVSQGQQQMLLGMGFDSVTSTFHGTYNQNLVPHMERLPSLGNPTASAFFANLAAELL